MLKNIQRKKDIAKMEVIMPTEFIFLLFLRLTVGKKIILFPPMLQRSPFFVHCSLTRLQRQLNLSWSDPTPQYIGSCRLMPVIIR